jgi:hypothetical protein
LEVQVRVQAFQAVQVQEVQVRVQSLQVWEQVQEQEQEVQVQVQVQSLQVWEQVQEQEQEVQVQVQVQSLQSLQAQKAHCHRRRRRCCRFMLYWPCVKKWCGAAWTACTTVCLHLRCVRCSAPCMAVSCSACFVTPGQAHSVECK